MSDEDLAFLHAGAARSARKYGGRAEDWLTDTWLAYDEAKRKFDPGKGIFRQFANHLINIRALDQFRRATKTRLGRRPQNRLDYASYAHYLSLIRPSSEPTRRLAQTDAETILQRYKHKGKFYLAQRYAGKPITFFTGNSTAKTTSDRVLYQMREDYAA